MKSEIYDADHIDGDRTNNVIANLRWLPQTENIRRNSKNPATRAKATTTQSRPLLARQVGGVDDSDITAANTWTRFNSRNEAARVLDIDHGCIGHIANNSKQKTATSKATGLRYEFKWAPQDEQVCPDETWRDVVVPDRKVWTETDPATLIQPKRKQGIPPQVSNYGRVRNKSGIFTPTPNAHGYSRIMVSGRKYLVHRLVYFVFVGLPPTSEHVIDHIVERYDAGEYFNRVTNLQVLTAAENLRKAAPNRASCGPQRSKPVRGRKVGKTDWSMEWNSLAECVEALGGAFTTVWTAIARGSTYKGYKLEYVVPADLEHEVWKDIPETMDEEEQRLGALRR